MKRIMTIMVVALLMLSFGCFKTGDGDGKTSSGKAFAFTGKNGLTASFDADSPPSTNWINDPIQLKLKLTNRGAKSLSSGDVKARIKGVAATEVFKSTNVESSNEDELPVAELSPTVSEVDLGTITYSPEKMFSAEYKPNIEAEVCFPYTTKVNINNFWVSSKQTDLDKGKISDSDNSDSPVHISNLKEYKSTGKVRVEFTVSNVGGGKIVNECFPTEKSAETVKLNVLEPSGVTCETLGGGSSGEVKLETGKKIVRCSVDYSETDNYQTPLVMELDYNYDLELSKTITIKNVEQTT